MKEHVVAVASDKPKPLVGQLLDLALRHLDVSNSEYGIKMGFYPTANHCRKKIRSYERRIARLLPGGYLAADEASQIRAVELIDAQCQWESELDRAEEREARWGK